MTMDNANSTENKNAFDRAREIIVSFGVFLESAGLDRAQYECDAFVLNATAKRYLDDVSRLKEHHGIKHIDCYKIAGYLSYWICKMKPFRVKSVGTAYDESNIDLSNKSFFINELFSLHMGLSRINAHYKKENSNKRVVLCTKHYEAMAYSLKYRQATGDILTLFFEMADAFSSGTAVGAEIDLLNVYRQLYDGDKAKTVAIAKEFVKMYEQNIKQTNPKEASNLNI